MIFSKEKWNSPDGVANFVHASSGLSYETMEGPLFQAWAFFLEPVLGSMLCDQLTSIFGNENPSDIEKQALRFAQDALANLALWYDFDELNTRLTDQGHQRQETESFKSLYKYQEDSLRASYRNKGFNALDRLLFLFNKNGEHFPGWAEAPAKVALSARIVRSTQEVDEVVFINNSAIIFLRLQPILKKLEQTFVPVLLGQKLCEAFMDKVDDDMAVIGTTTIKLDNVRILEREPVIEEKPSDPDAIYIGHCENTDGWDNVTFTVDSENHQEGKGCLSTSVTGNFVWIYNLTEAVDCSKYTKATGMLSLDLYVSNAAAMKLTEGNGEIEFSSTAKDDDHEFNWNIATLSLVDGWNHLDLPFSAAGISGEAPDLSSILHMRIYHVGWTADGPVTVKLDNIRVRQRPETTVMLYNCDDKGNWDGMAGVDTGDKTEGTGSLWWMNGAGWVMQNNLATPVNASAISVESGILSFDLWCESIADCKWNEGSGELEIGSTTSNDQQELAWNVSDIGAQVTQAKAWNHIDLKLSDAKKVGGNINMANIARIRFFHVSFTMDNNIQMKIDNIRLRD